MAVTYLGPLLIEAEHAETIYEPEIRAFGGAEAMGVAHALFHADSHHLLHHLAEARKDHRRELGLFLGGQDWFE